MRGIFVSSRFAFGKKIICSVVAWNFMFAMVLPPSYAQQILLPGPGQAVFMSPGFEPTLLKGMTVHPENPLLFDFIVDRGEQNVPQETLKKESTKLVKYFLTALTVPDQESWVNLSPTEKDRIIPDTLGQTEMGQTMLEQDYILKQLSASLTKPDTELGRKYWAEVGNGRDRSLQDLTKVWIVPDGATVVEKDGFAYILKSHLKVMMEEEYEKKYLVPGSSSLGNATQALGTNNQQPSSDVFRTLILPQIEKEVNEGKNFAPTRQVYQSVVLAAWYKKALKESLLGKIYVDKAKMAGVDTADKDFKNKVYEQYLAAFKKGVYNIIKEEAVAGSDETVPRKYFSGGNKMAKELVIIKAASPTEIKQAEAIIVANFNAGHDFRAAFQFEEPNAANDLQPAASAANSNLTRRQVVKAAVGLPFGSSFAQTPNNIGEIESKLNTIRQEAKLLAPTSNPIEITNDNRARVSRLVDDFLYVGDSYTILGQPEKAKLVYKEAADLFAPGSLHNTIFQKHIEYPSILLMHHILWNAFYLIKNQAETKKDKSDGQLAGQFLNDFHIRTIRNGTISISLPENPNQSTNDNAPIFSGYVYVLPQNGQYNSRIRLISSDTVEIENASGKRYHIKKDVGVVTSSSSTNSQAAGSTAETASFYNRPLTPWELKELIIAGEIKPSDRMSTVRLKTGRTIQGGTIGSIEVRDDEIFIPMTSTDSYSAGFNLSEMSDDATVVITASSAATTSQYTYTETMTQITNKLSQMKAGEIVRFSELFSQLSNAYGDDKEQGEPTLNIRYQVQLLLRGFEQKDANNQDIWTKKVASSSSPETDAKYGGINFDPTKLDLQIKRDGKGVPLPLPQQNLENINIKGLYPIMINFQTMTAVPPALSMGQNSAAKSG